jgi:hypothetical protein
MSEMSLSHHSWRSSSGAAVDRRFGAGTDVLSVWPNRLGLRPGGARRSRRDGRQSILNRDQQPLIAAQACGFRVQMGATSGRTGLVGAPSPARAGWRPRLSRVSGVSTRLPSSPHPVGVAGLASLPSPLVPWAAVPDLEARLFPTKPFRSGATRPAVVPFPPTATHKGSRSPGVGHELHPCGLCPASADQEADPCPARALFPGQLSDGHAARGGTGPPPVAWAPGSDGLVQNRRAH